MGEFKLTSGVKKVALIWALCLVVYNTVLFAICGFEYHNTLFWISYVFMTIAFCTVAITLYLTKNRGIQLKDWLLGYPIYKHSAIYMIVELIFSIIFMALDETDCPGWVAFVAQFLALVIHIIFIVLCFGAQDTIVAVQTKVKDKTTFTKLLQVDAEMAAERANNQEVKAALSKLAEQIRYSDPMSNEYLFELEKQITLLVGDAAKCVETNDDNGALQYCEKASLMLTERNKKVKALK